MYLSSETANHGLEDADQSPNRRAHQESYSAGIPNTQSLRVRFSECRYQSGKERRHNTAGAGQEKNSEQVVHFEVSCIRKQVGVPVSESGKRNDSGTASIYEDRNGITT